MINLVADLETLTGIPEGVLNKLTTTTNYIIAHGVYESSCTKTPITSIDLGFGELQIKAEENAIYYKFIPTKELEKLLVNTVSTGASPMLLKLDNKLQDRITQAYKELL